ncbi:hypothetical protein [Streptomyces sp. NRRL B-3648]|nr:hypothetical protein [Streptomyces sp. NRRL B-3648]
MSEFSQHTLAEFAVPAPGRRVITHDLNLAPDGQGQGHGYGYG